MFIDSLIADSFHMLDGSPQALCDHFQIVVESLHMFDDSLHLFDFITCSTIVIVMMMVTVMVMMMAVVMG